MNPVSSLVLQRHWVYQGYEDTEGGVSSFNSPEVSLVGKREGKGNNFLSAF